MTEHTTLSDPSSTEREQNTDPEDTPEDIPDRSYFEYLPLTKLGVSAIVTGLIVFQIVFQWMGGSVPLLPYATSIFALISGGLINVGIGFVGTAVVNKLPDEDRLRIYTIGGMALLSGILGAFLLTIALFLSGLSIAELVF